MNLEQVKEILEMLGAIATPVAAIVLSIYGWKKTGQIDLMKTLEHAVDVVNVVKEGIDKDGDEDKALASGIAKVSELRGKTLSAKLQRKLKARIETLVRGK
jgi:hypothetical protein